LDAARLGIARVRGESWLLFSLSVLGPPVNQGSGWMGDLLLVVGWVRSTVVGVKVERPQQREDERP
jgi:hypothetical protein